MTAAITAASKQIKALTKKPSVKFEKRQTDPTGLAALVAEIILEISGALNAIIADLGLGELMPCLWSITFTDVRADPLLSFLSPLLLSLSGLLTSLIPVVNNLLALVEALLDGLLAGLAAGLAGLL